MRAPSPFLRRRLSHPTQLTRPPTPATSIDGVLDHNRSHTQVFEYADAHFNLLFGGDGNIRCDGTDPNASGPVGSPEQSFDCIARALTDLDRLGLKLAFHPSDITATNCESLLCSWCWRCRCCYWQPRCN